MDSEAARLHRSLVVVDGHCDTAMGAIGIGLDDASMSPLDIRVRNDYGHIDIPRLIEGGVSAQFFALFTRDADVGEAQALTYRMLEAVEKTCDGGSGARVATHAADVTMAKHEGTVAALLAIEGGEAIGESLDDLRAFHARGVRLMTLTWNRINAIGRGAANPGPDGLTAFGLRVIAEMEKLGMIVDASHLCDQALAELLAVAQRPIVASHSNSRALCDHRRNLTDSQVEGIASTGGLIAVTFAGAFVDEDPARVSVARVVDHVDHLVSVVGAAHVGLGTDFDGFGPKTGTVMPDCTRLPELTSELLKRGYKEEDVRSIMGGNWLRVIQDVAG